MHLCGIDIGTSAVKIGVYDKNGVLLEMVSTPYRSYYPNNGYVEQNPEEIWKTLCLASQELLSRERVRADMIDSISLSTQRGTLFPVNNSLEPVSPALSWQDRRAIKECTLLTKERPDFPLITGLQVDPTWTIGKILWLKANKPSVFNHKFLLCQSYILLKLGIKDLIDDVTNASYTGLMNIQTCDWDQSLLDFVGIDHDRLPTLTLPGVKAGVISAEAAQETGLLKGTPIILGAGDQQAAALGAGIIKEGLANLTLGTAGVITTFINSLESLPKVVENKAIVCAHALKGCWQIEGLQLAGASIFDWFKRLSRYHNNDYNLIDAKIRSINPGSNGCLFIPYISGSAVPHWNPNLRGTFLGLSFLHGPEHMARAIMEGISFELRENIDAIVKSGVRIKEIRITGGAANSSLWCQMQANIYGNPLVSLKIPHASTLGAAILAGYGGNHFHTIKEGIKAFVKSDRVYFPQPEIQEKYEKVYSLYKKATKHIIASGTLEKLATLA